MKKFVKIVLLLFAINIAAQPQKRAKKSKKIQFTTEQQATLVVKKMTLSLDLSSSQQKQLTPLLTAQISSKKAGLKKRKQARKDKKRLTLEERFTLENKKLDQQITFQNALKKILTKEQYESFRKMKKHRKAKKRKKSPREEKKHKKHRN